MKIIAASFVLYSDIIVRYVEGDFLRFLKSVFKDTTQNDAIISNAFRIQFTSYNFKDIQSNYTDAESRLFYRPYLTKKFTIVSEFHLEILWTYLAGIYKTFVPMSVYSSSIDGLSLRTLFRKTSCSCERTPLFFIILNEFKELFGVFLDTNISVNKDYIGDSNSFAFNLEPFEEVYKSTGLNCMYAFINNDLIQFGGGRDGPALAVNQNLLNGFSYSSSTFNNKILGRNHFNVIAVEVLALDSSI